MTAYHAQSNGSIERSHYVLIEYLKTRVTNNLQWDKHLKMVMFSYNTSIHESTKFSPYELVFGRIPRLPSSCEATGENLETTYHEYISDLFNKLHNLQAETKTNLKQRKRKTSFIMIKRLIHKISKRETMFSY